eukprot:TRINITY_DN29967_c0_g1_i1.p1 TRINITY_DN29967_c0_g1~~TRINITY_DN29967_c0_g1_i1.p1  ORF type:complete len:328 (-),score=63.81 TRINITY_DN29967_c0_g1_i1:454-1437(-)
MAHVCSSAAGMAPARVAFHEKSDLAGHDHSLRRSHDADRDEKAQRGDLRDLFYVVTREQGLVRDDLPLWALRDEVPLQSAFALTGTSGPVERSDVDGVPGAFKLLNLLSLRESEHCVELLEALGLHDDGAWKLASGRKGNAISTINFGGIQVDKGSRPNCNLIVPEEVVGLLFERCKHLLPSIEASSACGFNAKFRTYKYLPGDHIKRHRDGLWVGSRVQEGQLLEDGFGDRMSMLTVLILLSDDFEGGATTFFKDDDDDVGIPVRTPVGAALCFPQGFHPDSPLHEGSPVLSGAKYIIRTDMLYPREAVEACRLRSQQVSASSASK